MSEFPPGLILVLGALVIPFLRGKVRNLFMIILPVFGLLALLAMEDGYVFTINILGLELTPVRVDRLSLLFGYIFHIAAIISIIYAFHLRDTVQQIAALIYAGTAIG